MLSDTRQLNRSGKTGLPIHSQEKAKCTGLTGTNRCAAPALGLVIAALTIGSTAVPAADSQFHDRRRPHVQEAWVRTELYLGSDKHDGTKVSGAEFMEFVDREVAPRFPKGLTLVTG